MDTKAWSDPYKRYCRDATATRRDYLRRLAQDYDCDYRKVAAVADIFGPSEDFDGLVDHLNNLPVWG